MSSMLYVADRGMPSFQTARLSADVVCAGDSITGWNNLGGGGTGPTTPTRSFSSDSANPWD
jgi:hypothetical protein